MLISLISIDSWKKYHQTLLTEVCPEFFDVSENKRNLDGISTDDDIIFVEEVKKTVNAMKNGRPSDPMEEFPLK